MRNVSPAFKDYILKQSSGEIEAYLITLYTGDIDNNPDIHRRICDAAEPIISQGRTFIPSSTRVRLPQGSLSRGRTDGSLSLSNIDRESIVWIRQNSIAPKAILEGILVSSPDLIEVGPFGFELGKVAFTDKDLKIPLVQDDLFKKPFQDVQFDPTRTPGLYA